MRKFIRFIPDGADGGWISAAGKTYRLMRAGKNAKRPIIGCASVWCDSGKSRKSILAEDRPIGNVMHDIINGIPIQPRAREWIVIVLRDEDWLKLEDLKHKSLRIIEGGSQEKE
jgi:hypothetical protein